MPNAWTRPSRNCATRPSPSPSLEVLARTTAADAGARQNTYHRGMMDHRFALGLLLIATLLMGCAGPRGESRRAPPFDPATQDLPIYDVDHPPLLVETQFLVDGARLNAIVYEAQGAGPHATVVLLHGFPGNERNLDLAQAVRRAGWNVVFFHYRGAWGSGGDFSFEHLIEDVAAVVDAISQNDFAAAHRIDPNRLALVGHSMGGFAALISGAELPAVDCVVSLAGGNLGGMAKGLAVDPDRAEGFAALLDSWSGPIRGATGAELVAEIVRNADRFDTTRAASALAEKRLLLIAGELDSVTPPTQNHAPMVEALEQAGSTSLDETILLAADHSFSGQRIALAREVSGWLVETCEAGD
jgi:uncharacterized protein